MAIASFNYLGLINNKLMEKAHEFCIRRLNGASILRIISEFMLENLIVVTIAFAFSLEIMSWIMPFFNELTGSDIDFSYLIQSNTLLIILGVILILLLITLLFSFSRINNQTVSSALKIWVDSHGKIIHIPVFNIFQLTVTIVLLVCAFVIIKQINYISKKDIGLDKEVIEVRLPVQYGDRTRVFKEEILRNPAVMQVSVTPASPLLEYWMVSCQYSENGIGKQYYPVIFHGDENFINTLGIKLIDGRNFSGSIASDSNNCIINESLVKYFGNQSLMGKKLPGFNNQTVIGIFRDFNFTSLKNVIAPGVIMFDNTGNHLLVKPSPGQLTAVRQAIKETWQKLIPDYPLNIESVRERFEWYHRENSNYVKLIGSCCFISLFLSMIGLFAISFNSSRKRTKEIGIRKINGATILEVMILLNKDFIRWVIIAFLIATPVAWFIMHKWLENYAYKTNPAWWIFAAAGVSAIAMALLTVNWQSWRVSTRNPVEALRYE